MNGGEKTVCVTGASGFIASWLVKLLLDGGYTVKATILNPNDPKSTGHLLTLAGAKERLKLFRADLLEEGSFDDAIDGCHGVFHTACPVFLTSPSDPQAELIDPAVKGTLNVLKSCAKTPTIKKIVLTSSMGAVVFNGKPLSAETIVDETWFSDPDYCKNNKQWYMLSKFLAEETAWKFAKENGLNLVAINPGLVIGPLLQPTLNATSEVVLNIINGKDTSLGTVFRFVDVRDVAAAHVKAFEAASATGRYILVGRMTTLNETLSILRRLYPNLSLPKEEECGPVYQVSKQKAESLGMNFTPLDVSLKDTVESLKNKGFLSI